LPSVGHDAGGTPLSRRDGAHIAFREFVRETCQLEFLRRDGIALVHIERSRNTEGTMKRLLVLLVALTMACGAAAGVTVAHAPVYADYGGEGY
jgi:hypothetical protein